MKKIGMALLVATSIFILGACGSSDSTKESKDYSKTNSTVKKTNDDDKATASVIVEKVLEERYKIDNFKVNFTDDSFKVYQMPDDKNAETGEEYKNLYNTIGNFTYQDKKYEFTMLYSLKNASDYSVIYFQTPMDESNTIDTPLESDK